MKMQIAPLALMADAWHRCRALAQEFDVPLSKLPQSGKHIPFGEPGWTDNAYPAFIGPPAE
jgi:hypothetical protein